MIFHGGQRPHKVHKALIAVKLTGSKLRFYFRRACRQAGFLPVVEKQEVLN
jgi:hypothetical protein